MPPGKPRSGALNRGLQNLEAPLHARRAAPTGACFLLVRKFPKGKRIVTFCGVQKVTQKARARTCKKLPVASFCASETAETGRIANGCEQGDHVSRSRLRPATSVQIAGRYVVFTEMTGFRQVTGYVRTAISHNIDGNDLNRCELQALHKRICGFVRTRSGFF